MLFKLILAFTLIPLAELYLLIKIGQLIGALNTVIIVILTAMVGAFLTRKQGTATMQRMRASMAMGSVPAEEIIDAVLIFVAGVVLITPGLLTDTLGFLLLIPATRKAFKRWVRERIQEWIDRGNMQIRFFS